jgi:hypothetical protein
MLARQFWAVFQAHSRDTGFLIPSFGAAAADVPSAGGEAADGTQTDKLRYEFWNWSCTRG